MNTNGLKKFAQNARRKLMEQVQSRLDYVMEADSPELREQKKQIDALRKEINRTSCEAVVEKVAYTWFNRLVALRYMDVNDYQPFRIRVISPHEGYTQPELLTEAKQGHIPDELKVDRKRINDLLNGSLPSQNPQNEVFRLLLIAACNHLHSLLPFLFEPIRDYTELLLPEDLTSEFSVVHDVIAGMTEEDCREVEVLGWLYQFYISEKKDEVFASKGKVKKEEIPAATQLFTPRWIVEYMVQNTVGKLWVLNHPSSKLKEHMPYYIESEVTAEDVLTINKPEELTLLDQACGSGHILVYGFELLYKIYEEEGYAPSDIPGLIIEHNLHGFEIDERAAQLAGLAILMKAREYQRRLFRKSDVPEPKITCFEDLTLSDEQIKTTLKNAGVDISDELFHDLHNMQQATNFGSLIVPHALVQEIQKAKAACEQAMSAADLFEKEKFEQLIISLKTLQELGSKFCCVVDNPPYMGRSNMNRELSNYVKKYYPSSKWDIMASFMESGLNMLKKTGMLGMINQHSWMFLNSYKKLRKRIIQDTSIDTLLHLGPRTFPEIGGEVVQNTAFTICNFKLRNIGCFVRLVKFRSSEQKRLKTIESIENNSDCPYLFYFNQSDFPRIPGSPLTYWFNENIISAFSQKNIGNYAKSKAGIVSGNDNLFLRQWGEISFNKISLREIKFNSNNIEYAPINKGGAFRRYYGNHKFIININKLWDDNWTTNSVRRGDKNYYFKKAISWSYIATTKFGFREVEHATFSTQSPSIYISDEDDYYFILGLLNSIIAEYILNALNPTLSLITSNIEAIPLVFSNKKERITQIVINQTEISKLDWNSRETSWGFARNELIRLNKEGGIETLEEAYDHYKQYWQNKFYQLHQNEEELNRQFIEIYGLQEELTPEVPLDEITILQDELDSKKLKKLEAEFRSQHSAFGKPALPFKDKEVFAQFISYAVGCMFGRYSLDKEGLVLANQGETLQDYLEKVSKSEDEVSFLPDADNIIPVLDEDWFEDDIVSRFYAFLKASFGEKNFEKNLAFVEEHITHGDIRKYFNKAFYKDHYKRYNKRPIYWMFTSPKGSFKALIYMHRYTPDTLNRMLNDYLRELKSKLTYRTDHLQQIINSSSDAGEVNRTEKEQRKLEEMLRELEDYERNVLMPLAAERIEIDLDDGVLVNYNKFGRAVEVIKGVNDPKKKKKVKEFDWIDASEIR